MRSGRKAGTSLVEVLVVIVVFLVGILAVVQVIPGGFKALRVSQNNSIANALARAEIEDIKNHADQLPEAIVPVRYTVSGGTILIEAEPERFPNDLGPAYSGLDSNGVLYDAANNQIGGWQYLVGPNIGRRVIGEGKPIPAPRQIGTLYGSLLTLQFAPLVFGPQYASNPVVYGNDLLRRDGNPIADGFNVRATEFFVDSSDDSNATLYFHGDPNRALSYNVRLTYYVQNGSNVERHDLAGTVVGPLGPSASPIAVPVSTIVGQPILAIEYDSVRVARKFDDLSSYNGYADNDWGAGVGQPNPDPYEYKLVSKELGLVLFNPSGYNYMIRRAGGRRDPLIGRVDYDVYDWRIIHDEFRAPAEQPYQYRLAIQGLKVKGEDGPDFLRNQGMGVTAPDSNGNYNDADVVLQDVDTGSLFMYQDGTSDPTKTSYVVNKSTGLVTLIDQDAGTAGLQMTMFYPGTNSSVMVNVDNRSLRALYMGKNEWAVQVMKPAAQYVETWARPGIGEFYLGGSFNGNGQANRIYFPPADTGRVVSIGELYYVNTAGVQVGPVQLTATVQANNMDTGGGMTDRLPYIPVDGYLPDFQSFDYTYGTAAKSVKGASVAVRVFWNPDSFHLGSNSTINMDNLDKWMQGWRRSTVETYLQRGY